ncbi:MAG: T9SS type A sorting domain-containing protein, partial [Bacteroidetes bacterium]|nr:T9SS type A sorting domain-containing protein [Bacteroidota bacterium]
AILTITALIFLIGNVNTQTITFDFTNWGGNAYYDFGGVSVGTTSSETYYAIYGSGFAPPPGPPLVVNAPTNFLISLTSGGTYSSQVTIPISGGGFGSASDPIEIYVVFSPLTTGFLGGFMEHRRDVEGFLENSTAYVYGNGIGAPPPPEMDILGNGQPIPNGSSIPSGVNSTYFGSVAVTGDTTITYTINNTGGQNLVLTNLGGGVYVAISGSGASKFSCTLQPTNPIAGSGSTTFDIKFDPNGVAGYFTANISIGNNDPDENPYTFVIGATSTASSPTITDPNDASSITSSSAISGANVTGDGGSTVTDRGICWKLYSASGDPTISDYKSSDGGSGIGNYTATINSLSAETRYKFRSYATNAIGTSYGSTVKDFWTLSLEPAYQPAVFIAEAYSTTQIDLTFSPASSITYADGYLILMKQGTYPDVSLVLDGTAYNEEDDLGSGTIVKKIISSTSTSSASITSLTAATGYYFTILPFNSDNAKADATYNYLTTSPKSDNATTSSATSSWSGVGSWNTASNWSNGIPGIDTDATIVQSQTSNPLVIDDNVACDDLTLNVGANVTINTGKALTVNGNFLLESDANGAASLIIDGTLSVSGTKAVERYINGARRYYVSCPTTGGTNATLQASPNNDNDFYRYDEPTNYWIDLNNGDPPTDPLTLGMGYEVMYNLAAGTPKTISFPGIINNNNISPTVTYSGPNASWIGWNLVGNPFPCAIDWDSPTWTKTNLIGSIYIWNGSQYISWNGSTGAIAGGIIRGMQGFFVRADGAGSPALTIPKAARLHSSGQFYKNTLKDLLVLNVEGNGYEDITFINFNEEATEGFDNMYDAYKLPGLEEAPQLYSIIQDEVLSINVIPYSSNNVTVQLGFEVGADGIYTITASEFESFDNEDILLEDLIEGITVKLKENRVYSFNASPGDLVERFVVHFSELFGIDEDSDIDRMHIYSYNNSVYINNTDNNRGEAVIYNVLGQEILQKVLEDGMNKIDMNTMSGYYIVRVITEKNSYTEKVFIK